MRDSVRETKATKPQRKIRRKPPQAAMSRTATETRQEQGLLGKKELAKYLGVSVGKVTCMVIDGTGPRYYRVGLFVKFKMEDVHAWLETRAVGSR